MAAVLVGMAAVREAEEATGMAATRAVGMAAMAGMVGMAGMVAAVREPCSTDLPNCKPS